MIQAAKRRDETLRRQFIRTRALAFPGGHAQERDDRLRLVPEPVRPGARRSAGRGAAARPRAPLDRHDLKAVQALACGHKPLAAAVRIRVAAIVAAALGADRRGGRSRSPLVLLCRRRRLLLRPLRAPDRRAAARRARPRAAARVRAAARAAPRPGAERAAADRSAERSRLRAARRRSRSPASSRSASGAVAIMPRVAELKGQIVRVVFQQPPAPRPVAKRQKRAAAARRRSRRAARARRARPASG